MNKWNTRNWKKEKKSFSLSFYGHKKKRWKVKGAWSARAAQVSIQSQSNGRSTSFNSTSSAMKKRTNPRGPPNSCKLPKHHLKYPHSPPLPWTVSRVVSLMFLCFCPCHVPIMSRLSPATGISSRLRFSIGLSSDGRLIPFGFRFRRNDVPFKRRLRFVIRAQLSEAFSPDLGLDSQVTYLLLSTSLLVFIHFVRSI